MKFPRNCKEAVSKLVLPGSPWIWEDSLYTRTPMQDSELYQQILGLKFPWTAVNVRLTPGEEEIVVEVSHPPGIRFCCPEYQRELGCYDHSQPRRWRVTYG